MERCNGVECTKRAMMGTILDQIGFLYEKGGKAIHVCTSPFFSHSGFSERMSFLFRVLPCHVCKPCSSSQEREKHTVIVSLLQ